MKTHLSTCSVCRQEKPVGEFRKQKTKAGKPRVHSWCKPCSLQKERERWSNLTRQKRQERWLKAKYNKDYKWFETTWLAQDKKCGICSKNIFLYSGVSSSKACVDHDHKTGEIRGLLCNHCNRSLGLLKENKDVIENMINYLERYHVI